MNLTSLLTTLVAALAGAGLATALRLPAAPLLGAMAGVALVKIFTELSFDIPSVGGWVVYCAVGWLLGQTVTREAFATLRDSTGIVVLTVAAFLVFGLVLAAVLWRFGGLDAATALLATAPGGIAQMGVLSTEVRANVPVVLAVHVLRVVSVILLMTIGFKLLGGRA